MKTKFTILAVEDERSLREAIRIALEKEGFEVLTADDGVDGLKKAISNKPDLILLDILMPNKSGLEMLEELRANPWGHNAAVIILTNYGESDKVQEAIKSRADFYLIKADWSLEDIIKQIKELLDKNKPES